MLNTKVVERLGRLDTFGKLFTVCQILCQPFGGQDSNGAKVDIFLYGDQFFFFLEKLRRDIDLILFASGNSAKLCCIKIFSASGRIR